MNRVDPDIAKLYVLILKHGMKVRDIPRAWLNVEQAMLHVNPDYEVGKMPGYVKMVMQYSTELERVKENATRKTKGIKE